jgi:hypothetical protein
LRSPVRPLSFFFAGLADWIVAMNKRVHYWMSHWLKVILFPASLIVMAGWETIKTVRRREHTPHARE